MENERNPEDVTNQELIDTIREHYSNCKVSMLIAYRLEEVEKILEQTEECYATLITTEIDATNRCKQLEAQLDRYRTALERLARLGNGDRYGNSEGNCIAQQALNGEDDE